MARLEEQQRLMDELKADCCLSAFPMTTDTFWLPATQEPKCTLERLAKTIFEKHTAGLVFDPANSGAEWWAQHRRFSPRPRESEEGHSDTNGASIQFHWDKDEAVYKRDGLFVHPQISTVSYFQDRGAPTVVVPACVNPATNGMRDEGRYHEVHMVPYHTAKPML